MSGGGSRSASPLGSSCEIPHRSAGERGDEWRVTIPIKDKNLHLSNGFRVAISSRRAQVAEIVLGRGDTEGGPDNRHRGSDQWMYVLGGTGLAIVNGRRRKLASRTLILIERGDTHKIRNTGRGPLRTLNFYVPPAYTKDGEELPHGRNK